MTQYYDLSNSLDMLEFQMESFTAVLEALASADSDDLTSGTMWFMHDTVKRYQDQIALISGQAMMAHIDTQEAETKKGKSKVNANGKKK
jgi:hypothetical protein